MNKTTKNLTLSAMFMAIGMVLPIFTGQIKQIGNMLLPMHLPVFLYGLVCGWQYGATVGLVLPLLILIPVIMLALNKTGLVPFKRMKARESAASFQN